MEAILEVLVTKCKPDAYSTLVTTPLCLASDLTPFLSGNTVSYLELT